MPKKNIRYFVAALIFLLAMPTTPVAGQQYYFRQYQVEKGLSNNAIICTLQDKNGFLWFGTKDGLNRFDGYSFKIFRHDVNDSTSIGSNFIHCLYQDAQGILWVGTEDGLYKYDPTLEQFSFLKGSVKGPVREVVMDARGSLWFIVGFTLYRLANATINSPFTAGMQGDITSICIGRNGTLWAATSNGYLQQHQPANNSFTNFNLFEKSSRSSIKWIEKIYGASNGSILVGTSNQGAKIFYPGTQTYHDFLQYNTDNTELFVRNFIEVSPDEYWVGTEAGIYIYHLQKGIKATLTKRYNDPNSLSDNAVYSFCKDTEGGIWVGTYFGGVNYLPASHTSFKKYFPQPGQSSVSGNIVREIHSDTYGNIWIGTEDAGLNKYNTSTKTFITYLPAKNTASLSYTNIHGLMADGDTLWVGTFEHGLDVMRISTGKVIKHYALGAGPNDLKSNFIFTISKTSDNQILIGTTRGAYYYNRGAKNFTPIPHIPAYNWYSWLLMDNAGIIWAATYGNGVNFYNTRNNTSGNFSMQQGNNNSLPSNRVNSIFQDNNNNLWFASEGGLSKFDKTTNRFTNYTTENGLPSNFVLSILQDDAGNLWLSTSKGLAAFNPVTQKTKVYTTVNGLLNDQFNFNSSYKAADGTMYFGSVKGFISFNPATFETDKHVPPVYITGLQIFNKNITITNNGPLQQALMYTRAITLPYHQSTISIDFAALGYIAPEMTEYAYRLDGLDKNWTMLKQNRKAYFTNLMPGTYTFRVKATNSSNLWNGKETRLIIKILPPWWLSNSAKALYTMLGIAVLFFTINYYHNYQEAKNKRKFEQLAMAKDKEIYQAKIDFFTNVAHEIKTPLTLIKAPLEKVIKKAPRDSDIQPFLHIMERNTDRLVDLTNQLLDFSQTEIQGFGLRVTETNITGILQEAANSFAALAEQTNIKFTCMLPATTLYAWVDADAFSKIIFNIFSNAVKYATTQVSVQLLHNPANQTFTIQSKNDGPLIPADMTQKIFEPFVRLKTTDKKQGTGIGLTLALNLVQLHKGTLQLLPPADGLNTFELTLPVNNQFEPAQALPSATANQL